MRSGATSEQEIAGLSSLAVSDVAYRPSPEKLWSWYGDRETFSVPEEYRLALFRFSLWIGAPAFYWIQGLEASAVKDEIVFAAKHSRRTDDYGLILNVSSFLGERFFEQAAAILEKAVELTLNDKRFPAEGRVCVTAVLCFGRAKPKRLVGNDISTK